MGRVYFLDQGTARPSLSFLSPLDCFREFINLFLYIFFPRVAQWKSLFNPPFYSVSSQKNLSAYAPSRLLCTEGATG